MTSSVVKKFASVFQNTCNRAYYAHNIYCKGRYISTSCTLRSHGFGEVDEKSGYSKNMEYENMSTLDKFVDFFKELPQELSLFKDEWKEKFQMDPISEFRPDEVDKLFTFETEDKIKKWSVTADSDHQEGFSKCSLTGLENGNALFSGTLSTQIPRDGRVFRAGYCNMRSPEPKKSFYRDAYYDLVHYTHIVIRLRGDGRCYLLHLNCKGSVDVSWNHGYTYAIHTRGGPYWQVVRIPFSKFFFTYRGRIQDKQDPINLCRVTGIGITACDRINGTFNVEIEYIGFEYDENHDEEFAYESYRHDLWMCDV